MIATLFFRAQKSDTTYNVVLCFAQLAQLLPMEENFLLKSNTTLNVVLCFAQLAQLLPMEENFLLLFRFDNPLESSVEFMKVRHSQLYCA
jgi:hypothetical protein